MTEAPAQTDTLYCANHPQTETALRCNRCNKPICARCVVRTPVGYRCRECVRGQQQVFETALWYDYVIAVVIALPLAVLGAMFLGRLGFFVILLGPMAGGITAEIIRAAVRRRRGRYLALAATLAFILGCLVIAAWPLLFMALAVLAGGPVEGLGRFALGSLWPIIFSVLASSALYTRLRSIAI